MMIKGGEMDEEVKIIRATKENLLNKLLSYDMISKQGYDIFMEYSSEMLYYEIMEEIFDEEF